MKKHREISKRWLTVSSVLILLSLMFTSCLKSDDSATYSPPTALVTFAQASPDQPPLDLYFNSNKVNQSPINYGDNLDYFSAYAGQRTVNIYNSGSMISVISANITLTPNNAYSLFLANKPTSPEIFLLNDTLNKPETAHASVRLVDLSPDAPAVDLIEQNGTVLVANKSYKGFSSFLPVASGSAYTFQVVKTGTTTVLATLTNVTINPGYVYTIWFHGLANPLNSTDVLSLGIITNAYFY